MGSISGVMESLRRRCCRAALEKEINLPSSTYNIGPMAQPRPRCRCKCGSSPRAPVCMQQMCDRLPDCGASISSLIVNPLVRSIALVTSSSDVVVPGAGAFTGVRHPCRVEKRTPSSGSAGLLGWCLSTPLLYSGFCLCSSADRRPSAWPDLAAATCLIPPPLFRLLHARASPCVPFGTALRTSARARSHAAARRRALGR